MRFHRLLISCALSAFLCAASAQAEVVLGNLGNQGTGLIGTTGYQTGSSVAIPFRTGSSAANLTDVVIGVQGLFGPSGSQQVAATLYPDNGGEPANLPLGWTASLAVSDSPPSAYTFSATPFQLAALTDYWMIVSPDVAMEWIAAEPPALPTARNGSDWSYPAGGALFADEGSWSSVGQQNAFSVSAVAVPEPSTFALAAIAGLAGFGAFRRRKQQA